MTNYTTIGSMFDRAGELKKVCYALCDPATNGDNCIAAIELTFEEVVASVYAEGEFDTIRIELAPLRALDECEVRDVTASKPWFQAVGCTAGWIWLLRNQQGYEDGMRLEFGMPGGEAVATVTLIVVASVLEIYVSKRVAVP